MFHTFTLALKKRYFCGADIMSSTVDVLIISERMFLRQHESGRGFTYQHFGRDISEFLPKGY